MKPNGHHTLHRLAKKSFTCAEIMRRFRERHPENKEYKRVWQWLKRHPGKKPEDCPELRTHPNARWRGLNSSAHTNWLAEGRCEHCHIILKQVTEDHNCMAPIQFSSQRGEISSEYSINQLS
jgi:hypothetical protein